MQQERGRVEVRLRLVDGTSGTQKWSERVSLEDQSEVRTQRRALRAAMDHAGTRLYDLEKQRVVALGDKASTPTDLVLRAMALRVSGTTASLEAFRRMESLCEAA